MTTKKAEILSNGMGRWYISYGATRSRADYATPANAARAARAKGCTVLEPLPVAGLVSIANRVNYSLRDGYRVIVDGVDVKCLDERAFNDFLNRLGYKAIRLTRNMMNPDAGDIVIDADTPSFCDVGSESYWSM